MLQCHNIENSVFRGPNFSAYTDPSFTICSVCDNPYHIHGMIWFASVIIFLSQLSCYPNVEYGNRNKFRNQNVRFQPDDNKMSWHVYRSKYMIFHTSGCKMDDISLDIRIENNSIEQIRKFNFLGLTINETMTWSSHVGKIASKIGRTVGVLHKLKHYLPKDVLKTIYNSLISPHLHFGVLS